MPRCVHVNARFILREKHVCGNLGGQTGEAFPLGFIGEKCRTGVVKYNDANRDITRQARGHEFLAAIVHGVSGKTLARVARNYKRIDDPAERAAIKAALSQLKLRRFPGMEITAPRASTLQGLYEAEQATTLMGHDSNLSRQAAKSAAKEQWYDMYHSGTTTRPSAHGWEARRENNIPHLLAKFKRMAAEYKEERDAFTASMALVEEEQKT